MLETVVPILWGFASALLLTIAAEAPVAWLFGLRTAREQLALLLVNVITNPLFNLLINALAFFGLYAAASPWDPLLLALECAVAAAEAMLLKASLSIQLKRAAALSLAANTASWLAGALLLWQ